MHPEPMNESAEQKCSCQECGGHIIFPRVNVGETAACPHCNAQTCLLSNKTDTTSNSGKKIILVIGSILLVLAVAVIGMMFYRARSSKPLAPLTEIKTQVATNAEILPLTDQLHGFQIGPITFRQAEGSSLVYAIGVVRNDTDHQRFGVRIRLDLLDDHEHAMGSTSDYIQVLEPHQDWHFKALLTTPKAVKAKLANIEEQN